MKHDDGLGAARSLIIGLPLGLACWLIIALIVRLVITVL